MLLCCTTAPTKSTHGVLHLTTLPGSTSTTSTRLCCETRNALQLPARVVTRSCRWCGVHEQRVSMPSLLPRVLLVIVDGLGDVAITQRRPEQQTAEDVHGTTPLQSTPTPHLDALASQARLPTQPRCLCLPRLLLMFAVRRVWSQSRV